MPRYTVTVTPPRWVTTPVRTLQEWAGIAHVKLVRCHQIANLRQFQMTVIVEGESNDLACFARIIKRNTTDWS